MTQDQYGLIRDVVMAVISVLVFLWGRDRKQVAEAILKEFTLAKLEREAEFKLVYLRLQTMEQQLEDAREESSKQSGRLIVQLDKLQTQIDDLRGRPGRRA